MDEQISAPLAGWLDQQMMSTTVQQRMHRDDTFWRSHEQQRRERGLSIPQYWQVTGLALSTYRHRINRLIVAQAKS